MHFLMLQGLPGPEWAHLSYLLLVSPPPHTHSLPHTHTHTLYGSFITFPISSWNVCRAVWVITFVLPSNQAGKTCTCTCTTNTRAITTCTCTGQYTPTQPITCTRWPGIGWLASPTSSVGTCTVHVESSTLAYKPIVYSRSPEPWK